MNELQRGALSEGIAEEGLGPVKSLQNNASQFFERVQQKYGASMNCKKGCSACCHVSLTLFESEAARIVQWALSLPDIERDDLKSALFIEPAPSLGLDATGKARAACAALRNNACAIYEARPVICRTQGAPLQWKAVDAKGEPTIHRDHCPLNFEKENSLPPLAEHLDLDKLTVLQSIAQNHWARSMEVDAAGACKSSLSLWPVTPEGRVELKDIVSFLKELL